jgi:alkyl sulfatase BDS1-like metallo-beta-lactamase superfamily hydrolase
VWRSVYLSGANELRHGIASQALDARQASAILGEIPLELFFAAMANRLDGEAAGARDPLTLNFVFTDLGETWVLSVENGVLHHRRQEAAPEAAATVHLTRPFFLRLVTGQVGLEDVLLSGDLDVDGSRLELLAFFGLLDGVDGNFPIVTP